MDPIDIIWGDNGRKVHARGYCGILKCVMDYHLLLWYDISFNQAFGNILPKVLWPSDLWLKFRDPRIVKKYHSALKMFLKIHKVCQLIFLF